MDQESTTDHGYRWDRREPRVRRTLFPRHPLITLEFGGTGIVYECDIYGRLVVMNAAQGPLGVVAAMLRDLIEVGSRNVVQFSGH